MQSKTIFLIIIILVVFVCGAVAGFFYKAQQTAQGEETIKTLSSKFFALPSAYGTVQKISGKNITISKNGQSVELPVAEIAQIYSSVDSTQQTKTFSDVKVGDKVSIISQIMPNNKLEIVLINILP